MHTWTNLPARPGRFYRFAAGCFVATAGFLGQNSRTILKPTSAATPRPPLSSPAPIPAVLAGCHAREMMPAPRLLETRLTANVLPGRSIRGTMNVVFSAYSTRGHVW